MLRELADAFTDIRYLGGCILAADIIEARRSRFRSWKLASFAGAVLLTDKVDGWLARKSNIPSPKYASFDQDADRSVYRDVMYALGTTTLDARYFAYAGLTDVRNSRVKQKREQLRDRNLDASSKFLGKIKTCLQDVGMVADLSPIGEVFPSVVHVIHTAAVVLTGVSGVEIVVSANQQLAHYDTIRTEAREV